MFWIELMIVLSCIFIGARLRGVGLGVMGGLGLAILTFGFHLKPNSPPYNVLLVILGVVTAGMVLEGAGGLAYLTRIAERLIKKHPNQITIVAPIVGYCFSFLTGTSHITYSLLPIISDVALDAGIRPERPLAATAISSLQAIIASPISAATALTLSLLGGYGMSLISILKVTLPSTFLGVFASILVASRLGKDLNDDPELADNLKKLRREGNSRSSISLKEGQTESKAKLSIFLFILGVLCVVLTSLPQFSPVWEVNGVKSYLPGHSKVAIIMLSVAAISLVACRVKTSEIIKGKIARAGFQAVIAILGVAWLGNTLFFSNIDFIKEVLESSIKASPWKFAPFLFFTTVISTSQAATLNILFPLGLSMGMTPAVLVGFLPAINGLFFIPGYPTMVAALEFDKTGSTSVGRFVLNHSFMLPGLAAGLTALTSSMILSKLLL